MCSKCSVLLGGYETQKKAESAWNNRLGEDAIVQKEAKE